MEPTSKDAIAIHRSRPSPSCWSTASRTRAPRALLVGMLREMERWTVLTDSPDLHSSKAPRILPRQGVTLLRPSRALVCVMDANRNQDCQAGPPWRSKRGTAWPASSAATQAPDGFPPSSHRVPAATHVSQTGIRVPWGGSRSPKHGEELKRDRMGTESEPPPRMIEPNGERLGTEWGLRPFTIEQTTEDVTAIHRLAASRPPRATGVSPPAAGSDTERAIRVKAGAMVHAPAGRTIRTASCLGTSSRRRARSERQAGASARTASERDRSASEDCGEPRGSRAGWPRASSAGDLRTSCERQGGR
jgi:hypothetical protein